MDCTKDLLELDSEVNNLNLLKKDDPFLPVLPSPEIPEELLEEGFKTPSVTPLHSPHAFLKEDRWLFSPPPVINVTPMDSELQYTSIRPDNTQIGSNLTPCNPVKEKKSTALRKRAANPTSLTLPLEEPQLKRIKSEPEATNLNNCMQSTSDSSLIGRPDSSEKTLVHPVVHPILVVRPVTLPVGSEPIIWQPPSLLQIVTHPTPNLVRKLATSRIPYVSSPVCQISRK